MPFSTPAPNVRDVSDPSIVPLVDRGTTLPPSQTCFVEIVLNRPTRRTVDGLRPMPPQRPRAKSHKGPAPQPPKASGPVQPARPPSPTEASRAAWRLKADAGRASASEPPEVRPELSPEVRPEGLMTWLLEAAERRARKDASRTRFERLRDRMADAIPAPLRRAWRAIGGAARRMVDRLRPRGASPQA